ncbi:unnamed protein product [Ceutorhynchus assimilis]|uniref:Protein CNPPD1 n=1 Tax=Ceutorhynchus assimilis TaxID=467358 RepID=A0A9N9MVD3_9CUCU|nr:unnamed protein product [Ceutorhynchus assimilis]
MSKIYKQPPHCKGIEDHQKYLSRITKTLYYGKLPKNEMLSLPVTELAVEIFSEAQRGKSLNRLQLNTAARISRNACVSPCSLVLAMLYFERLKKCNVDYLERTMPADLFLVSLMVSSKFLFDDGEMDEVFIDEWAASSGMTCKQLRQLEKDFLNAIDWNVYANEITFWKKLNEMEIQLAIKEGKARGHFTYTELQTLGDVLARDLHSIVQCVVAVSIILAATYTAALFTIVGSVALVSTIPGTSLYQSRIVSCEIPPTTKNVAIEENDVIVPSPSNQSKVNVSKYHSLNALKVLKASILLASIKTDNQNYSETAATVRLETNNSMCQYVSWDWWNIPIMNWLTETSDYIKSFEIPAIENYLYFIENAATNEKIVYLEDHIHKATKTRIQDQMERSWHMEWTDTIKHSLTYFNILPHLHNIKH